MKHHSHRSSHSGFTVVEIMIVVMVIALLAAIAVPNFVRSRKRARALRVLDEIRVLQSAIDQYTIEHNRTGDTTISASNVGDFLPYIKPGSPMHASLPNDFIGNPYNLTTLDTPPKISSTTFGALSDVAPTDFWSPYYP